MTAPSRAGAVGRRVRALLSSRRGSEGAAPQTAPDLTNASSLFRWCQAQGDTTRRQYLWAVLQAAISAKNLGLPKISVLEFGVAGGNGLVELERAASRAESLLGVTIEVVGFDTGTGMPEPKDYRDVPWVIRAGYLGMDEAALRARLQRAQLVLGPVADTVQHWLASDPPPVGFISYDLDYYSSTMDAFGVFESEDSRRLPRVVCYFDDVFGYGWSDYHGERAAIRDFNDAHLDRKIAPIYGLHYELPPSEWNRPWPEQIYLFHSFQHPLYNVFEGGVGDAFLAAHKLNDG